MPVYSVRGRDGGFELLDGWTTGLSGPPAWAGGGRTRRRVAVRVSPQGLRTATLLGRPLRVRPRPRWDTDPTRPDWVEATLLAESLEDARMAMLALGPEVEVVTPPELRETLADTAERMGRLYGR